MFGIEVHGKRISAPVLFSSLRLVIVSKDSSVSAEDILRTLLQANVPWLATNLKCLWLGSIPRARIAYYLLINKNKMKKISSRVEKVLTSVTDIIATKIKETGDFDIKGRVPPLLIFEFKDSDGDDSDKGLFYAFDSRDKIKELEEIIASFALSLVAVEKAKRVPEKTKRFAVDTFSIISSAICLEHDSDSNEGIIEEPAILAMTAKRNGDVFVNVKTIHRALDEQLGVIPIITTEDEVPLNGEGAASVQAWMKNKESKDPVQLFWEIFNKAEKKYKTLTFKERVAWDLTSLEFLNSIEEVQLD
jgi:hypothetical protein